MLSSSNYDWGQGVPELQQWQRKHPAAKLVIWSVWRDPAIQEMNVEFWPASFRVANEKQLRARLKNRYFAVGTTILYGGYYPVFKDSQRSNSAIAALQKMQPIDRTTTFLIFDLSKS